MNFFAVLRDECLYGYIVAFGPVSTRLNNEVFVTVPKLSTLHVHGEPFVSGLTVVEKVVVVVAGVLTVSFVLNAVKASINSAKANSARHPTCYPYLSCRRPRFRVKFCIHSSLAKRGIAILRWVCVRANFRIGENDFGVLACGPTDR